MVNTQCLFLNLVIKLNLCHFLTTMFIHPPISLSSFVSKVSLQLLLSLYRLHMVPVLVLNSSFHHWGQRKRGEAGLGTDACLQCEASRHRELSIRPFHWQLNIYLQLMGTVHSYLSLLLIPEATAVCLFFHWLPSLCSGCVCTQAVEFKLQAVTVCVKTSTLLDFSLTKCIAKGVLKVVFLCTVFLLSGCSGHNMNRLFDGVGRQRLLWAPPPARNS